MPVILKWILSSLLHHQVHHSSQTGRSNEGKCVVEWVETAYWPCILHTMLVPRGGLHSMTVPSPASWRRFIARTAPSLFPLSLKLLAASKALICSTFLGRRREWVATEWSCRLVPVLTTVAAVKKRHIITAYCISYDIQLMLTGPDTESHQLPLGHSLYPQEMLHVANIRQQSYLLPSKLPQKC